MDKQLQKTKLSYKFAGVSFEVDACYQTIHDMCKDYRTEEQADNIIKITKEDIAFERERSIKEDIKEGIPVRSFSDDYLETLSVYRKVAERVIDYDTILFHGSLIAVDGEGYLFTAKSGVGKSTHTRLWREEFGERAVMVNDDKPLINIQEGKVTAFGTPWNGKHKLGCNMSVPLKAICVLNRDKDNHIERISGKEVYALLVQQTYRSSNPMEMMKTLKLLDRMMETVKFYSLGCNMEKEAARVAFYGMN